MPLTSKGEKILNSMRKTYNDEKKAKSVFYASINKGTITGAEGRALGGVVPFGGYAEGGGLSEEHMKKLPSIRSHYVPPLVPKIPGAYGILPADRSIPPIRPEDPTPRPPVRYAFGGLLPGPTANPVGSYFTRQAMRNLPRGPRIHVGPIMGHTMGRGDKVGMSVAPGSYVLPADHVSGLGQGNTNAGFKVLHSMFSSGPYGSSMPRIHHGGMGIPKAKVPKIAAGGTPHDRSEPIEIQAADGEYVLSPEQIIAKFGDLQKGHKALDEWVVHERRNHVDKLRKLPGPVKD